MCKEKTSKSSEKKDWTWILLPPGVIVLCVLAIILTTKCMGPTSVPLSDDTASIALAFIGILATFIVVGNYAQVSAIRSDMERRLDRFDNDYEEAQAEAKEEKENYQTSLQKMLDEHKESMQNELKQQKNEITSEFKKELDEACENCIGTEINPLKKQVADNSTTIKENNKNSQLALMQEQAHRTQIILSSLQYLVVIVQNMPDLWEIAQQIIYTKESLKLVLHGRVRGINAYVRIKKEGISFEQILKTGRLAIKSEKISTINGKSIDVKILEQLVLIISNLQTPSDLLSVDTIDSCPEDGSKGHTDKDIFVP